MAQEPRKSKPQPEDDGSRFAATEDDIEMLGDVTEVNGKTSKTDDEQLENDLG